MPYQAIQLGRDKRPSKGTVLATGTYAECLEHWKPEEVCIGWIDGNAKAPKKLSAESLGSMRRKRLMTRLRKKFPMFADQLFEQELQARPEHFYPKENQ